MDEPKDGETNGKDPKNKDEPADKAKPPEIGGPKGPEPTRYNDWEKAGRCIDF